MGGSWSNGHRIEGRCVSISRVCRDVLVYLRATTDSKKVDDHTSMELASHARNDLGRSQSGAHCCLVPRL
jgi:hypothetical protein